MENHSQSHEEGPARPAPHYVEIKTVLEAAIACGKLPEGTILTEGAVAKLFGTSRTPVRTAFSHMLDDNQLRRFDGRGFVVGGQTGPEPQRRRLTSAMLGLDPEERKEPKPDSAELIAHSFQTSLTNALPFGMYRINEQAAADHFGVSRNIVRDLLGRFRDRGLVRKDLRSHWVVGPLTARDVSHFFAIRAKLEPLALLESAPLTPSSEIERMRAALDTALKNPAAMGTATYEALEQDMHVRLLENSPNPHLLRMVGQTQLALVVNSIFAANIGASPFGIALREHEMILEFIIRGSHGAAAQSLEEHIRLSAERTRQRLIAISVFPHPDLPRYLQRHTP
ncbi:FCD domain-containing protein [Marimonas sp. MJW-29]|uniref:FCD domain-containing protein n=1 Tax=Sulfitobacter sediminis TaxID=3234186 RepID=A0ABV3RQM7_9RHOB